MLTLSQFANQRFRFSGKAIAEKANPYLLACDKMEDTAKRLRTRYVSFAHYDYLGLRCHPELTVASMEALKTVGVGSLASRLIGGERQLHQQFEQSVAKFVGVEDVIALVSGYLANLTLISHLIDEADAIFIDELSHNSLYCGAKASTPNVIVFNHNNTNHLRELLSDNRDKFRNVLIVTEGLFSMDGDVVDLPALLAIKEQYDAWLMVDEAHSIGVLGKAGKGICEYYGVSPNRIDLITGTLSKSFVTCGGFVGGRCDVIEWLRYTLPGFVYSVGLSPVIAATANRALAILRREPERVERLTLNSKMFLRLAREEGLNTGNAIGHGIIPVLCSENEEAVKVSLKLLGQGFYAPPIIEFKVNASQPRLRFFISASHSEEDIATVIKLLAGTGTRRYAVEREFST